MKNRNASAVLVAATAFALTAALIVAGCSPSAETRVWKTLPKPAALPMADESGLAPVDDIQMWYAIFNKSGGNPVLLIHGGTAGPSAAAGGGSGG